MRRLIVAFAFAGCTVEGGKDVPSDTRHSHTITIANTGGNETRPRNVTVNDFIRID